MSAPRTNVERQTRNHRAPLIGMGIVVAVGVLAITYWIFEEAATTEQDRVPTPPAVETAPEATGPANPGAPVQGTDSPGTTTTAPVEPGALPGTP